MNRLVGVGRSLLSQAAAAGVAVGGAGIVPAAGLGQARAASSHAENTNTFIREVRVLVSGMHCLCCLGTSNVLEIHTCRPRQALNELEYPEKLQKLLLTPNREMGVELVVQVRHNLLYNSGGVPLW